MYFQEIVGYILRYSLYDRQMLVLIFAVVPIPNNSILYRQNGGHCFRTGTLGVHKSIMIINHFCTSIVWSRNIYECK